MHSCNFIDSLPFRASATCDMHLRQFFVVAGNWITSNCINSDKFQKASPKTLETPLEKGLPRKFRVHHSILSTGKRRKKKRNVRGILEQIRWLQIVCRSSPSSRCLSLRVQMVCLPGEIIHLLAPRDPPPPFHSQASFLQLHPRWSR
ncbi:hypothetical protein CEXT_381 [Caerostris extrusa]|uniref:Uncharacterized protein n=1 Tax=Caerostris extrusa TaxID=172846 RepID=A0AAV4SHT7_CAEEX|nr:hypothetical protein CEXT_381 [Caerostris extrusa]